jgi:hypothetical protein
MKVGFIFECGEKGADIKVVRHLVQRIDPKIEFMGRTLDSKPKLVQGCGAVAKQLLADGCDRVFIVWDLYPAWREKGKKPCRHEDRMNIFECLASNNVTLSKVVLICITEELEAWLMADGEGLSKYLSTETRKASVIHQRYPDRLPKPKKQLDRVFQEHRGNSFRYVDFQHAEGIVRLLPDFSRLKRSESFSRFHFKLTGALPK